MNSWRVIVVGGGAAGFFAAIAVAEQGAGVTLLEKTARFRDTVDWFAARGVELKTESDGRMFPTTNSSQTIIDCLMNAATKAGVKLRLTSGVESRPLSSRH